MEGPRPQKLTVEDYWELPDDGRRYEVLEGWLEVTPSPVFWHQKISGKLHYLLLSFLRDHPLGEVVAAPMDVILAIDTVCQPDLLFIRRERVAQIVRDRIWGAPDLVVEILSPGTAKRDRFTKAQIYARHGVDEYWIVDPDARTIQRHTLRGNVYGEPEVLGPSQILETPLLPGLKVAVEEVVPVAPTA